MDLGTPIAMIVSIGVVVFGIILLGGNVMDFIDLASIMLTVVPTIGAIFISFPVGEIAKTLKHFPIILGLQKFDAIKYVNDIMELAEKARSQGLLSLESAAESIEDKFLKNAAIMVADATDPELMEERLYSVLDAVTMRHSQAWAIYEKGATFAPAFGMVATLVSLVNMLMNLNFADAGGVSTLGLNMSAAMITTFYGSLMANVFFAPISTKLRVLHQREMDCKKLVIEGFLAIQNGTSPKAIKEMLVERLDPKLAAKLMDD